MNNDTINKILSDSAIVLSNVAKVAVNAAKLTTEKVSDYKTAKQNKAEEIKKKNEEAAHKAESEKIASTLRNAFAYALTQVPESLVFYDVMSKYALTVNSNTDGYYVVLPISKPDKARQHFHTFDSKLQNIFDALHEQALATLQNRIYEDARLWMTQQLEYNHTGVFRGISDAQLLNEYFHMYNQWTRYLYRISSIHSIPTDAGVAVHFQAVLDDAGLHPNNYYQNCRSVM